MVTIEDVLESAAGPHAHRADGFDTAAFPYMTDIALLPRWGKPLLYGPGSILVAHTDDEYVEIAHLERAVDRLRRPCASCRLSSSAAGLKPRPTGGDRRGAPTGLGATR